MSFSFKDLLTGNSAEERKNKAEVSEDESLDSFASEIEEEEEYTAEESPALEVRVVRPKKYSEVPEIANYLLNGKVVFLNLESTDKVNSTRILDYLMGAIYILKGDLQPVSSTAFMIGPSGVDITGALMSESASSGDDEGASGGSDFGNL